MGEPWTDLVSDRVGIVKALAPQRRGVEEPEPPFLYTAELSNFDFRTAEPSERMAAGKGTTAAGARAAAVGEAVERYCAFHWDPARTVVRALSELEIPAITPADCVLYSAQQYARPGFEHDPWDPEQPITWITGAGVPDGEPVALPAALVYLSYPTPRPQDRFTPATSNGLAAGPTLPEATLSALCEVMERDALMIAWMQQLPARELDLEAAGGTAAALWRHYARAQVAVRAFALPTDLPAAVVLAMACEDRPDRPATVVGMGCHPSPAVALTKALYELCQARPAEAARFRSDPPAGRLRAYEDVRTLEDHSAFAALPERRDEFAFLWRDGATARIEEFEDRGTGHATSDLAACAGALQAAGHRVAAVDLTTPDVEGCGYRVTRVIAAGLQPIHFGFGQERLGGERLYALPERLGLPAPAALNPCPHPMA